jgi:dihydrofolate reductase
MRKIIACEFISMDGVIQAPGGPQEDTTNGFKWGGWTVHYWDDIMNEAMNRQLAEPYDLLLGRFTYDIFAAHWPYQEGDPMADTFNRIKKYVVSTKNIDLPWENSVLITADVINQLKAIKNQDAPDLIIFGSSKLVQTLMDNQLIDVLYAWVFPITLGKGKRLFSETGPAGQWKLINSVAATTGTVINTYVTDGEVKTGEMESIKVSDAELARRAQVEKQNQ